MISPLDAVAAFITVGFVLALVFDLGKRVDRIEEKLDEINKDKK